MPRLDRSGIDEAHINAVERGHEPVKNIPQHFCDLRKASDFSTALEALCIVNDSFESKNTFAFAIDLEGKAIEMHLEHRQIIDRFLDRDFKSGRLAARGTFIGAIAVAEDGLERRNIQSRSGSIDYPVEHGIYYRPSGKEQVPAELKLVDRKAITEVRPLLLSKVQCKAKAGGINPTLAHIDQPPSIPIARDHGLCAPVQCGSVGYIGKTVVFFGKNDASSACRPLDILMPVENDHGVKGRMWTEADDDMSPLFVHNVECVVVGKGVFLPDVDAAVPETVRLEDRSVCPIDENAEKTGVVGAFGKMFLDQLVLAVVTVTIDYGNVVLCGKRPYPAAEMSGESHQMCIVQGSIIAVEHTPPRAETPAAVQQWVICIDDDTVDAVVRSVEQIGIIVGELVDHSVHCPVKADVCGYSFVGATIPRQSSGTTPSLNPHNRRIRDCGGFVKRKIASVVTSWHIIRLQNPSLLIIMIFFSLQIRSNRVSSPLRVKGRRIATVVTVVKCLKETCYAICIIATAPKGATFTGRSPGQSVGP